MHREAIGSSGTLAPLLSSKADCYKRYGVDPVKDAAIIEKWFTEAAYHAPEDAAQNTQDEDTGG